MQEKVNSDSSVDKISNVNCHSHCSFSMFRQTPLYAADSLLKHLYYQETFLLAMWAGWESTASNVSLFYFQVKVSKMTGEWMNTQVS